MTSAEAVDAIRKMDIFFMVRNYDDPYAIVQVLLASIQVLLYSFEIYLNRLAIPVARSLFLAAFGEGPVGRRL